MKYYFLKGFILFIGCSFFLQLGALDPNKPIDDYLLDEWHMDRGLPSVDINAITQTTDGYLWLGTPAGLVRYDGLTFETVPHYSEKNQIYKSVKHLLAEKDGGLWIGSYLGLMHYKKGVFKKYSETNGISPGIVAYIERDSYGRLWVAIHNNYINRFENKRFTVFNSASGLNAPMVLKICEDKNNCLWFAGYKNGLFYGKEGVFKKYNLEDVVETNDSLSAYTVYTDRQGILWVGTNRGIIGIEHPLHTTNIRVMTCSTPDGLSDKSVWAFLEDSDNNLWVGTASGLNRVKIKKNAQLTVDHRLENTPINCLFEDSEKNLWVGTSLFGLKRLRDGNIRTLARESGVNPYPNAIYKDRKGTIWLGDVSGDIYRYENGSFKRFIKTSDSMDLYITSISEDNEGTIWVGTMLDGVFRIEGQNLIHAYKGPSNNNRRTVSSIFQDSRGIIWITTYGCGLWRYYNGKFSSYDCRHGLKYITLSTILEDREKNLWIGTHKGAVLYQDVSPDGELKKENLSMLLTEYFIKAILQDRDGTMWFGTQNNGLFRFRDKKMVHYTMADGLVSDNITQIIEDDNGGFWMSSMQGIIKVAKKELNEFAEGKRKEITCITFGLADGMLNTECAWYPYNSIIRAQNGELWFSTRNGISIVRPDSVRINNFSPPSIIETILFNGENISGQRSGETFKDIRNIRFKFTAPTFIAPRKTKLFYKLEGSHPGWRRINAHSEREAIYENLPPGEYSFKVYAVNNSGVRSREAATFNFTLERHYYQTLWFRIIFTLVLLSLVTGLYFGSRRYLYMRKLKNKYKNSTLDPEKAELVLKKIRYLMSIKKIYRDENLAVKSLAEKLNIAPRYISQVINEQLNKNFRDFVNGYRIKEAKRMLKDTGKRELSMIEVAIEVGFNSKEVFNRAFKKYTGTTPSKYKNS